MQGYIDGGNIAVDVIDTGPGPSPELADKMFDVLVTGKPEGVGFGLALAKQVADEQGGTLSWERIDGRTRFRLVIPAGNTLLLEKPQTDRVTTPTAT